MDSVRWGIVGCGDVTEVKSGPALQKVEGSQLVAVMRRDAEKAADYARRHGVPRWYDDARRLIDDPEVDAVYVATPPGMHEQYALLVCAAGKPCYVEKPMARNAAEAQRMTGAFAAAGIPLFVAYYRRALPRFVKAKEILVSGALGGLRQITYRYSDRQQANAPSEPIPWRLQAEQSGGGLFLDLGSHALDLLDFFLGPLSHVQGDAANRAGQYAVEDYITLSFETADGVPGAASWDFASDRREDEFVFTGDRGELRLSCFGSEPVCVRHADGRTEAFDLPNPPHVQQPLLQTVVDVLRGVRAEAPSMGVSALRTQRILDCALERYYGGREDGFWNRPWQRG